jgi:hypothetical protein
MTALRDGWAKRRLAIEAMTDEEFEAVASQYTYAAAPITDGLAVLGAPGPEHPRRYSSRARSMK